MRHASEPSQPRRRVACRALTGRGLAQCGTLRARHAGPPLRGAPAAAGLCLGVLVAWPALSPGVEHPPLSVGVDAAEHVPHVPVLGVRGGGEGGAAGLAEGHGAVEAAHLSSREGPGQVAEEAVVVPAVALAGAEGHGDRVLQSLGRAKAGRHEIGCRPS